MTKKTKKNVYYLIDILFGHFVISLEKVNTHVLIWMFLCPYVIESILKVKRSRSRSPEE